MSATICFIQVFTVLWDSKNPMVLGLTARSTVHNATARPNIQKQQTAPIIWECFMRVKWAFWSEFHQVCTHFKCGKLFCTNTGMFCWRSYTPKVHPNNCFHLSWLIKSSSTTVWECGWSTLLWSCSCEGGTTLWIHLSIENKLQA